VKGFAVGRTIFADAARGFMAGDIDAAGAVETMRQNYARLCALWDDARATAERHAA
jgi:5-dehydro-2-deoxygluconokinase